MRRLKNKKSICLVFIYALLATILCSFVVSCSSSEIYTFDGIYSLEASSEGRLTNYGTCFYINGKFVTNAHLVTYKSESEKVFYDNIIAKDFSGEKRYSLTPLDIDYEHDCCTLETPDYNGIVLHFDKNYKNNIGDRVFSVGNLNNYGLAYGFGMITSETKIISNTGFEIPYVQTNIEISSGCSGGPVFNTNHSVIGIMSMKLVNKYGESIDGASFYVPISLIDIF